MNGMNNMNGASIRSSLSSYGDPKYASSISVLGVLPPPSKALVDGYRSGLDSIQDEIPRYNPLNASHSRSSVLLNANDPVVLHLLTETAIGDSMHFEVLSFEEAEGLKKELLLLTNRIDSSKRKLALEMKLRDAALSLSRLSDGQSGRDSGEMYGALSPKSARKRMSFLDRNSWGEQNRSDSELAISTRKCEELAQELWKLERRASELRRRLLEHTAGVLQMTHKGLKKRPAAGNNLPRSQDIVYGARDHSAHPVPPHEFDNRSLYWTADHLDEYGRPYGPGNMPRSLNEESRSIDMTVIHNTEKKLEDLSNRLRQMLLQANSDEDVDPVPNSRGGESRDPVAGMEAHLAYLERNLSSIAHQQPKEPSQESNEIPEFVYDAEEKLEQVNLRLDSILKTSGSHSPLTSFPPGPRRTLQEQLDYLEPNIDIIQQRVESLAEQKTILTTQIQQQRELNSKSDAERDAHFAELHEQIAILKKDLDISQRDASGTRDELTLVMDQLDAARQESMIREQQRTEEDAKALSSVKEARMKAEEELSAKNDIIAQLEGSLQKERDEKESKRMEALAAKESSDKALQKLQSEYDELESEMIRVRTELTMVQAELDGAYGSRAERAAQVAANPAIQKEIDDLNQLNRSLTEEISILRAEQLNNSNDGDGKSGLQTRIQMLEKELRDTIDDYEVMTKASIEFEKERDKLETFIDNLRDRCESLESKLCEERVQNLGNSSPGYANGFDRGASETTSTMVLKNEFKKMMRDTRAENMRLLKAEQEERRRLEALIRNLRKEQSVGKSNLSQSTISS
ncbi:involucrin repeat protein [Blastomyces dermatitidis ATCC 18188]|uniref:Involucrin repeat protein n=2 Tax=Ajellomyces dermatitidis TaxID=5039 RepID=F2THG6_AJEDA|nr:involucrin repeat protein [Blastomyces dermatitidis ATCC 18188]